MGFAKLVDRKLEVVDVFIGGLVLLDGKSLRFVFPEHLSIAEVSPKPDTCGLGFVGWAGRKVFQDGEHLIDLAPSMQTQQGPLTGPSPFSERPFRFLDSWVLAAFGVVAAVIAIGAVALTRGRNKRSAACASDDVGMVLEAIRRYGGAVDQSKIVKESGLSKSTVSTILKVLEREGVLVRQKAGREKLVRLAR
jgi:predicted transcriptional regulator